MTPTARRGRSGAYRREGVVEHRQLIVTADERVAA